MIPVVVKFRAVLFGHTARGPLRATIAEARSDLVDLQIDTATPRGLYRGAVVRVRA